VQQKSVSKLDLGLALHFSTHFPFFAANQNWKQRESEAKWALFYSSSLSLFHFLFGMNQKFAFNGSHSTCIIFHYLHLQFTEMVLQRFAVLLQRHWRTWGHLFSRVTTCHLWTMKNMMLAFSSNLLYVLCNPLHNFAIFLNS
jgi:hypothetical protein